MRIPCSAPTKMLGQAPTMRDGSLRSPATTPARGESVDRCRDRRWRPNICQIRSRTTIFPREPIDFFPGKSRLSIRPFIFERLRLRYLGERQPQPEPHFALARRTRQERHDSESRRGAWPFGRIGSRVQQRQAQRTQQRNHLPVALNGALPDERSGAGPDPAA